MRNHNPLSEHDSLATLQVAVKQTRDPVLIVRLKAILLRKRGKDPQEIASSLLVTDRVVRSWVNLYNANGIAGLKPKPSGRKEGNPKWNASIFEELATEIDRGGYWSIPRMQEWLIEHKKSDVPEQTVWYRMDKLGYSYKSSRPHPTQGNKDKQESFKKGVSHNSWNR